MSLLLTSFFCSLTIAMFALPGRGGGSGCSRVTDHVVNPDVPVVACPLPSIDSNTAKVAQSSGPDTGSPSL